MKIKMVEKLAKDVMEDFVNLIYLDMYKNETCVIEEWNRKEGFISVRYQDGRVKKCNDVVFPNEMKVIGRLEGLYDGGWKHDRNYEDLSEKEKEIFRQSLGDVAQKYGEALEEKGKGLIKNAESIKNKLE